MDIPDAALVIVVDDDPLVRGSLDSLFRSVGLATRCHPNPSDFLDNPAPASPCCIVVDVRMPGIGGFEFQGVLNARGLDIPIIFMTGHGDIPMSVRAMKAGAVDFLAKPFRDQDMLDAVNSALALSSERRSVADDIHAAKTLQASLTPREHDVMAGVVRGLLNKQIAGELGIVEATVKMHRANVLKKMGVRTVADLVRLVDLPSRAGSERSDGTGNPPDAVMRPRP